MIAGRPSICYIFMQTSHLCHDLMFFKWAIPGHFLFIFVFSILLAVNKCSILKISLLDLNHGPLSDATTLPIEPQPPLHLPVYKMSGVELSSCPANNEI